MPTAGHRPEITKYLHRETLKHIVLLKALSAYGKYIQSHYFSEGSSAGVLFVYPTKVTTYESVKYPNTEYVVLISSDTPAITERLLEHTPVDCGLVIKLTSSNDKAVVARQFTLDRVTSFLSYTHPAQNGFSLSNRVTVSHELDDKLLPFYRANGYERNEVKGYFNSGSAMSFSMHEADQPVSACIAYKNYGDIWEIAGLYTIHSARRKGYAREIVATALSKLLTARYLPRYQMDESNFESMNLAERLGMRRFLTTEHFLCAGKQR